ncbi:hypothetical protein K1Y15_06995 [Mammaliicoccus sciuri]|uniref:hypothetical protein n=1 Tax=Mammaliicoccus sciuri TaxID=1296 RepID=UPI00195CCB99|nr:hypothetical protein [Mammaliicoccus sciuri]MCD8788923.1 hypothetical protein [Mammaliicoccus sciuri]
MSTDIILEGKQSELISKFIDQGIFNKNNGYAEIFYLAVLAGMFEGKEGEIDSGGNSISVSRVYLTNRPNFKYIINIFENLEKKFKGIEMTMPQIFLDSVSTNDTEKFQSIKNHGYAGLEILNNHYFEGNKISDNLDVVAIIDADLKTQEELNQIEINIEPKENTIDDILEGNI